MAESQSDEISRLKAECAVLRGSLAGLIAGLHGRVKSDALADWRDGTHGVLISELAGSDGQNPYFAEAFAKIRDAVLTPGGTRLANC
jgi:hypothetical protein